MFKNIIFFRYKLLCAQLKNDKVDEFLAVKYMIFSSVLARSAISVPVEITPAILKYARIEFILSILEYIIAAIINVVGILYLYNANNQGDGRDFFKRIICLAFPVSLFVTVVYGLPAYFLLAILTESFPVLDKLSFMILMIILQIVYYRKNYDCLLYISGS
jgi:hypothetical protein